MVDFVPIDRPHDAVVSDVTQSNSCTTPDMQRVGFKFTSTNMDSVKETVGMVENQFHFDPARTLFNGRAVRRDPHDVESCFRSRLIAYEIM